MTDLVVTSSETIAAEPEPAPPAPARDAAAFEQLREARGAEDDVDAIVDDLTDLNVVYAKNKSRVVKLAVPFTIGGQRIDRISLRPVTVGDLMAWAAGEIPGPVSFIARLSGLSEDAISAVQFPDADKVFAAFLALLPRQMRGDFAALSAGD